MVYTAGLFVGLYLEGYLGRYCYNTLQEAKDALEAWDGAGDPPGAWLKYKGVGGERQGPGLAPPHPTKTPTME
jgi:hypothetical protein